MISRALGGFAALAALAALGQPGTSAAGETVQVRVGCVLASNSGKEIDQRLIAMRNQFSRLFRYSSYSLVKEERARVALGSKMGFDVPGGRYLVVIPKEITQDGRLALKVLLLEGSRPIVNTAVSLRSNGTFLVAGPQSDDGALILAIGAEKAEEEP